VPGPARLANSPDTPTFIEIAPSPDDLVVLHAAFKALLSKDPEAKAVLDQMPNFAPFTAAGINPPPTKDGNYIIGPNYTPSPDMSLQPGVPQGQIFRFSVNSTDSPTYPGIAKEALGTQDPNDPTQMLVNIHPQPYVRLVAVYVPAQYVPGTAAPLLVSHDGPGSLFTPALDNLIAQKRIPPMVCISIANGGGDAQGSERGLEYDTMSGLYAEYIEKEIIPRAEKVANVTITKDPEGRAVMGSSSGGSAAFSMAWYHPELYHRVLTYSGTYVNQQWPRNPATPGGAWDYHTHLIPENPAKPLRVWLEVGERDNYNPNVLRDNMHDWLWANWRMANVLAAKGYHYQLIYALNAGHTDSNVRNQTLPEALEWLWQGYSR
jgi:enterochelin esterase-like enzyme